MPWATGGVGQPGPTGTDPGVAPSGDPSAPNAGFGVAAAAHDPDLRREARALDRQVEGADRRGLRLELQRDEVHVAGDLPE